MNEKMVITNTKPTYESLKHREEELLAQLKELREDIKIAENGIVEEKLNTAIQCLVNVAEMAGGYYRCTVETYCDGCKETVEVDIDLAEIISALQQLK